MAAEIVVSAVGEDRPGIVAALAEALFEVGGNLLDTSMTILRGRFAMVLLVRLPDGPLDVHDVERTLDAATAPLGVRCTVAPAPAEAHAVDGAPYVLSVYGADRPGLVARVTRQLATAGVNITDVSTRLIGDRERPVYAMVLDVVVPDGVAVAELSAGLEAVGRDLGVHCRFHPAEEDVL